MDDLQHLVPFLQVVKCGSFTAAATQLGVTPPAISKSIARLERELGVRLLQRTTRQIHLTTEGRDFFEKINALTAGINDAVEQVKNSVSEPRGQVRLHVAATFGRFCLMPVLAEFLQRYPAIQLDMMFDDGTANLVEGGFDLCIRYGQGTETSQISRRLCAFPIVLVASPAYLARRGAPRHPGDLAQHDCINIRRPEGMLMQWRLRHLSALDKKDSDLEAGDYLYTSASTMAEAGDYLFTPGSFMVIGGQLDLHLPAALAGMGICTSAIPIALPFLQSGQLKLVLPDYRVLVAGPRELEVFLQYPHRKHLPPKIQVLTSFLLESFRSFNMLPQNFKAFSG